MSIKDLGQVMPGTTEHRPDSIAVRAVITLATGGCCVLAMTPIAAAPALGCLALAPWLALRQSLLSTSATGLAIGLIIGAASGWWIPSTLVQMGLPGQTVAIGTIGAVVGVSGLPFLVIGVFAGLAKRLHFLLAPVATAAGVAIVDVVRSEPQLGIPWGLLGYSQHRLVGVAQLAALGGVPAVSALIAGLACAAAHLRTNRRNAIVAMLPWLGAYIALALLGDSRDNQVTGEGSASVILVQTDVIPGERWNSRAQLANLAVLGRLTSRAMIQHDTGTAAVIWPEMSLTEPLTPGSRLQSALSDWAADISVPLFVGAATPGSDRFRYHNSVVHVGSDGKILGMSHKSIGVPLVESPVPLAKILTPSSRAGQRRSMETGAPRTLSADSVTMGFAICFEILFPRVVSKRVSTKDAVLVNPASDGWYGSRWPGWQQVAAAVFRAIENRTHVLRASDGGPTIVVDPSGRIVTQLGHGGTGWIKAGIDRRVTPPKRGDAWVALVAVCGALLGFGLNRIVVATFFPGLSPSRFFSSP